MGTKTKQINISNLRKYFSLKEIKGGQAWSLFCDRSTDCAYNNSTDWRAKVLVFGHKILFNLAVFYWSRKKNLVHFTKHVCCCCCCCCCWWWCCCCCWLVVFLKIQMNKTLVT
uniref:Uncharacterized protein n=1 Tax=Cacopsylla melanoneura TaxID=428564 RepID=A0A8D9E5K0_9HEMI